MANINDLISDDQAIQKTGGVGTAAGYAVYQKGLADTGSNAVDTTAQMNPGVTQAESAVNARGNMTPQQIAQEQMQGVDKSSQLATQGTLGQQNAGLGGSSDPGMQQAIANRAAKAYGSSLNNISQQAQMNSTLQAAGQRQAAMAGMASVEDLKTQAANTQMVQYQNDQAKKNAVLNTVLGLGGAIAGAAGSAIGGPVGGAIGNAIGQGISGIGRATEGGGGNTQVQTLNSGGQNSASYFGGSG